MVLRNLNRVTLLLLFASSTMAAAPPATASEGLDLFEKHIRPVLVKHCYSCHSATAEEIQAGLLLDTRDGWQQGGDSGPAVAPQDPDESLLLKAIRYDDDVAPMPPDQKLSDEMVARFQEWIGMGAPDPREGGRPAVTAEEPASDIIDHWAFQPPKVFPPAPDPAGWAQTTLDRYVAAARQTDRLSASPRAEPGQRIRRVYFDLIGLPPTYEQIEAFVADSSPDAYSRLVESLLVSPRFGERWARHWLDVARFADTKGYVFQEDRNYPEAYRYRDWVIRSLNQDRPYDEFVRYQLAGDSLCADQPEDLAAMGYLTLGRRFLNNRHDIIDDRIDVVTRGLMALTVTCARCHDHKYDPIPIADYYSLYGVFASSEEPGGAPSALRMVDRAEPRTAFVFLRGNPQNRGPQVPRQFLQILSGADRQPFQQGSGRLEMAQAIASGNNPLTARVLVNRVWGHLFGSYLVDTPSDFGTRCDRPRLLPALDYLAVGFMEHQWSIKWLVREIVTSATYQQASLDRPAASRVDPENRTYWKMNRRRLNFEAMRDAVMQVSGQLRPDPIGGPSQQITGDDPSHRRSLYAFVDRQNLPGLFRVFDVASPDTHAPKRFQTTVPQQALFLMNSPFLLEQSRAAAQQVLGRTPSDVETRVRVLHRQILGRDPSAQELDLSRQFVESSPLSAAGDGAAWEQLAQVLLLSNEFLFVD